MTRVIQNVIKIIQKVTMTTQNVPKLIPSVIRASNNDFGVSQNITRVIRRLKKANLA